MSVNILVRIISVLGHCYWVFDEGEKCLALEFFIKNHYYLFMARGIFAFVVLGVVLAVTLSQPTSAANRTFSDLATLIIDFLVFTALLIAALQTERSSHQIAIAWGVLTLAMFFYVLGDVCWALVELYLKSSPVASVFSSIYIVYYPLFLTGFLLMPIISLTRIQRVKPVTGSIDCDCDGDFILLELPFPACYCDSGTKIVNRNWTLPHSSRNGFVASQCGPGVDGSSYRPAERSGIDIFGEWYDAVDPQRWSF